MHRDSGVIPEMYERRLLESDGRCEGGDVVVLIRERVYTN
jgi:hypothetical protein